MSLKYPSNNLFSKIQRQVAKTLIEEIIEENSIKVLLSRKKRQIAEIVIKEETTAAAEEKNILNLKLALTSYIDDFKNELKKIKNVVGITDFFEKMSKISDIDVTDEKFNKNELFAAAEILVKFGSALNSIAAVIKKKEIPDETMLGQIEAFEKQQDSLKTLFVISTTADVTTKIMDLTEYSPTTFMVEFSAVKKQDFLRLTTTAVPQIKIPEITDDQDNTVKDVSELETFLKKNINDANEIEMFLSYTKSLKDAHPLKNKTLKEFKEKLESSSATTIDKSEALEFFQEYQKQKPTN